MTGTVIFLWFIVTGGVTILGELIYTAAPKLGVISIVSLFLCLFHMHCNLGEFRSAYFDLNLKQRCFLESGAYKRKYNTKKQEENSKLFMVPLVINFLQDIL